MAHREPSTLSNWAGNITFNAAEVLYPCSVAEVQDIVRRCPKLRVSGSKHSFNRLADTEHTMISLEKMNRVLDVDPIGGTVRVEGGITYGQLCPVLDKKGLALHNLASLPHISIAGAVATGTHGSGMGNGNLATAVKALEFVSGVGEVVCLDRIGNPEEFAGAVVSIGSVGVVTAITLEVQPRFDVSQVLYGPMSLEILSANADSVMGSEYSVSAFTTWVSGTVELWCKRRHSDSVEAEDVWPDSLFGAPRITSKRHPISEIDPKHCTEQEGHRGPWYDRLPHFQLDFTPSAGEEIQSEYFVPWSCFAPAIEAIAAVASRISPVLQVSELRSVAADELWLSPHHGRRSLAIHFTWARDWPRVRSALALVDAALRPFEPRPHLGKTFTMSPERLRSSMKAGLPRFCELVAKYDPDGKFRNTFVEVYLLGLSARALESDCSNSSDKPVEDEWLDLPTLDVLHADVGYMTVAASNASKTIEASAHANL